jgi:hypothetical protein
MNVCAQMLKHYLNHRDPGPARFLNESMVGVILAGLLGKTLPRFLELADAATALEAARTGDMKAEASAVGRAQALLSTSRSTREESRLHGDDLPAAEVCCLVPVWPCAWERGFQLHAMILRVVGTTQCILYANHRVRAAPKLCPQAEPQLTQLGVMEAVALVANRLSMHAGHANAVNAWPSGTVLEKPYIFTPHTSTHARLNPSSHVPAAEELVRNGHIVLQFIDSGEAVAVRSETSDDLVMAPLAYEDLWGGVHTWYPHRVPVGDRIEGMSVLGRLLVAAIEAVIVIAGFEGVQRLKVCAPNGCLRCVRPAYWHLLTKCLLFQVILHVDEVSMDSLMENLLQCKLYGLRPANVLVLPIPRFFGYHADASTTLSLAPNLSSAPRSAGSGFAMLSCGWSYYAYKCEMS